MALNHELAKYINYIYKLMKFNLENFDKGIMDLKFDESKVFK